MSTSSMLSAIVVDDDPFILMIACEILEAVGFQCQGAENGDIALDMLFSHAEHIGLLFSDVEMPGERNGFALAHHVSENWPWIEIVIASGRAIPAAGALPDKATFLSKPYSSASLHEHLRRNLPPASQPRRLAEPS